MTKTQKTNNFSVGDIVEWTSHGGNGTVNEKSGVVIGVLEEGEDFSPKAINSEFIDSCVAFPKTTGYARSHTSYIVGVPHKGSYRVYWPVTSKLRSSRVQSPDISSSFETKSTKSNSSNKSSNREYLLGEGYAYPLGNKNKVHTIGLERRSGSRELVTLNIPDEVLYGTSEKMQLFLREISE